MHKLFAIVVALFSSVVFSSAVIAHSLALSHSHEGTGLQVSHGLFIGVIVLGFVCLSLLSFVTKK